MQELSPQPPQPVQNNLFSSKNLLFLLLFSIILIILSTSAAYFYFQSKKTSQIPSPSLFPTKFLSSPTSAYDETANWKTYSEPLIGFSIKYPNNWYQQVNSDFQKPKAIPDALEDKVMFSNLPPPFQGPAGSVKEGCRFDILIANTLKDPTQTIKTDNYKKIGGITEAPLNETNIVVNAVTGIKRYYSQNNTEVTLLPGKNKIFAFYSFKGKDADDVICNSFSNQILSTFKFLDQNQTSTSNGVDLKNIKYTLPQGLQAKLSENNLFISAIGGGYLSITSYIYDGTTGRREFFCKIIKFCIKRTTFTQVIIGNISGYYATALDNSGGGSYYFGLKGTKFYIIEKYSPSYLSPNGFDLHYQEVLNSLVF